MFDKKDEPEYRFGFIAKETLPHVRQYDFLRGVNVCNGHHRVLYTGIKRIHFHVVRGIAGNGWTCPRGGEVMKEHPCSNRGGHLTEEPCGDPLKKGTVPPSLRKQRHSLKRRYKG